MASSAPVQSQLSRNFPHLPPACVPIGLDALYSHLLRTYPTQRNPIQAAARQKYWMGGADPLDYVNIYFNIGDRSQRIPPHWHYVGMGISDLYGDGRIHRFRGVNQPSGMGFELTFRLAREQSDGMRPPIWPVAMMQHLARYIFNTGRMAVGDFIKWDGPLDGKDESRIQHILLVNDPQLSSISTPCGTVEFLQIVGICEEERKAVQKWNVFGVSELLRKSPSTGGQWLITDLRRGETVFDVDPCAKDILDLGVASEGSSLSGIKAWCWWTEWAVMDDGGKMNAASAAYGPAPVAGSIDQAPSCSYQPDFNYGSHHNEPILSESMGEYQPSDYYSRINVYMEHIYNTPPLSTTSNPDNIFPLPAVHIKLNAEAATFIPLALKGRLAHGRHFTFKTHHDGQGDITLLPPGVAGSFATTDNPYAYRGNWLHIQVSPFLQEVLLQDLGFLEHITDSVAAFIEPRSYQWPLYNLKVTILPDVPGL